MIDYRKALVEADNAQENGYSLSDKEREVALNAITGYFNHVRIEKKYGLKKAVHSINSYEEKHGNKFEERIFNWINNKANDIIDVVDFFPALVSLGYQPSHDIKKLREAEEFAIDYMINSEDDDELPCTAWVFYEFEKSAFLPCELSKIKSKTQEMLENIFAED